MENKEIEYGTKISNGRAIIKLLSKKYGPPVVVKIERSIYKTSEGKYFFKVSRELSKNKSSNTFSLKEDLLKQGKSEGMKIADEVDVSLNAIQIKKMEAILGFLGYEIESKFNKTRNEFIVKGMSVVIDNYETNDYFEVEGGDEKEIKDFVCSLPIERVN